MNGVLTFEVAHGVCCVNCELVDGCAGWIGLVAGLGFQLISPLSRHLGSDLGVTLQIMATLYLTLRTHEYCIQKCSQTVASFEQSQSPTNPVVLHNHSQISVC